MPPRPDRELEQARQGILGRGRRIMDTPADLDRSARSVGDARKPRCCRRWRWRGCPSCLTLPAWQSVRVRMVRMREEAWSFGISYSNHLKLNSLPVRQSQPKRAIAWRNNDLSIRYIRSVLGLFGPVMVDVWAWRSRVKAESYRTCNYIATFAPFEPARALHSTNPDHASCANVSWLTVTATMTKRGVWPGNLPMWPTTSSTTPSRISTHGGGPDATRCDL